MNNDNCPLCGSNHYIVLRKYQRIGPPKFNFSIIRCAACGHYYSPLSANINYSDLYKEGNYKLIDTRGTIFDRILSIDHHRIISNLSKIKLCEKTLLDFGCGKGLLINRLTKYGWKVQGVETAKNRADYGIQMFGLNIQTEEYNYGKLDGAPFSVVTLFHVLEHLGNPKELLKNLVENNLSKTGYIVLEVPLFDSIQSKIAGKRWLHLDPPLHQSHFTKKSLNYLIKSVSLFPVKHEYFSIHLGILGMTQSLMSILGYRGRLISDLKFNKSFLLILGILTILPIALFLELLAVLINKGGIIRVYCKRV